MEFGLFNLAAQRERNRPPAQLIGEMVAQVRLAEELGFGFAWFAEHHFSNLSISPSPLMAVAHCAPQTSRLRLGTGVLVLPLYQPLRLLEEIAYTDILCDGRLMVGIGSGSQNHENRGLQTDMRDAHDRFLEVLDILEMGWRDGVVAYDGAHFQIPETALSLTPVQQPRPQVFLAGLASDPEIQRRIGEAGYTPFAAAAWQPAEEVLAKRLDYEAGWRAAGRQPETMPMGVQRWIYVTDNKGDAREAAEQALYTYRIVASAKSGSPQFDGAFIQERPMAGEPSLETILEAAMIGDAEHCAALLARDIEVLRPSHYSCFMQFGDLSHERVVRSMKRFVADVLPLLERRFGDLNALASVA